MNKLPSYDILAPLAEKVSTLLENEITPLRPPASTGEPGNLVYLKEKIPVIIVPDIHARIDFLKNILKFKLPAGKYFSENETIEDALNNRKLYLLCLGDGIHNETERDRWYKIAEEFMAGEVCGKNMIQEMTESLGTLQLLMELKLKYPDNFYFLKGNHENVMNVSENGDFAFVKFADEGEMVKQFIRNYYGDDILYLISCYENALPLIACGNNFAASHAEPAGFYSRQQMIDARLYPEVIKGLIWTSNGQVTEPTVEFVLKELLGDDYNEDSVMFGGHRPVKGDFSTRQKGRFIQIHNTFRQNIVIMYPDECFNSEKSIINVQINTGEKHE